MPYYGSGLEQSETYIETLKYAQCLIDQYAGNIPLLVILVMGDLHTVIPDSAVLTRKWYTKKPYNKWSVLMYEFMEANDFCVADFQFEQLVNYTYKQGNKRSYIDHILIPEYQVNMINSCDILYDSQDNMSDHLAISINMDLPVVTKICPIGTEIPVPKFPYTNWSNPAFKRSYLQLMKAEMDNLPLINPDSVKTRDMACTINQIYEQLCSIMHRCADLCSTRPKSSARPKHWWNSNCTSARNRNKLFYYIWKSCGQPTSGTIYNCYKDSKKAYRHSTRAALH